MDDQQLDQALAAMGRKRMAIADPPALHERAMAVPLATQRRGGPLPSLTEKFQSMFSATKFVVAGAIVALFGVLLLIAQPLERQAGFVPGATSGGPGAFSPTGSLAQPRAGHTATLLPDGRVLVVGGDEGLRPGDEIGITGAEIWDPEAGTFGPTGSLADGRVFHTATRLTDGRVLVVGGWRNNHPDVLDTAEVWDPSTGLFTPAGTLAQRRESHTAILLPDGRVLIAGGWAGNSSLSDTLAAFEVWDPVTGTFSQAGSPAMDWITSATLLHDGRVFVTGQSEVMNEDGDREHPVSTELWDPVTGAFSPTGAPAMAEIISTTLLPDGRVLLVAACSHPYSYCDEGDPDTAELWDPGTSTFSPAGALATVKWSDTPTALPDGRVLVVGISIDDDQLGAAEVWDPATASFGQAGLPDAPRVGHTATLLPDGRVLVVGGGWGTNIDGSAEVWSPSGE